MSALPHRIPGLVLAGGLSRRMGTNKAMVMLGDAPLLSHVVRRISPQVSDVTTSSHAMRPGPWNTSANMAKPPGCDGPRRPRAPIVPCGPPAAGSL